MTYLDQNKKVVLLLSDKRSGSTFFEEAFCQHHEVGGISWTNHSLRESHFWTTAAIALEQPEKLFYGGKKLTSYGSSKNAKLMLKELLVKNSVDIDFALDTKDQVFMAWELLCQSVSTSIFFEKSPQHIHHWAALDLILQWANRTQAQVYLVGLIRNPMAVLYSADELFHSHPEERQFSWLNAAKNLLILKQAFGEKMLLLRYEDMTSKPLDVFHSVQEHVGVKQLSEMGMEAHEESRGRWLDDLEFAFSLDPSVSSFATLFGYSESEMHNPKKEISTGTHLYASARRTLNRLESALYQLYRRLR